MSLQTDIIFYNALAANEALMQLVGCRVYNTADENGGEFGENTPVPYIIITYDGMANDQSTKDSYEGATDKVTVSVEIAATNRDDLAIIAETVRSTIPQYFASRTPEDADADLVPYDYDLQAGAVQYDWMKPCLWQTMSYVCDTKA